MRRLKVAALLFGDPGPLELWTLRAVSAAAGVTVVRARGAPPARLPRAAAHVKKHGLLATASRFLGAELGARIAARDRLMLEELFDFQDLRAWWEASGIPAVEVPSHNDEPARAALAALAPDVIVRVSGGILKPSIHSLARLAALNIHHGQAPVIRGMWSIPWGIVEGRREWIGATVHIIDDGVDTGPVLWRGSPQLAPGDTYVDLLFRAHLEAAKALARILSVYAAGEVPRAWPQAAGGSTYKSAAGLADWLKLLYMDRGRRARVLLERGLEC